jgi:hypothetical protein
MRATCSSFLLLPLELIIIIIIIIDLWYQENHNTPIYVIISKTFFLKFFSDPFAHNIPGMLLTGHEIRTHSSGDDRTYCRTNIDHNVSKLIL